MISVYCLGYFSHSWMRRRYYVTSSSLRELLKVFFFFLQFHDSYLKRQSVESHLLWSACTSNALHFHHTFLYHHLFIFFFHLPQEYSKKWHREPLKAWPTPVQEMCKGTNRIVPTVCRQGLKQALRSKMCTARCVCVCVRFPRPAGIASVYDTWSQHTVRD